MVELLRIEDDASLCVAEVGNQIPFEIKRVYYLLKPKPGELRGSHAHRETDQILFCIQGTVKMVLDDGKTREEVCLPEAHIGVRLPPMMWHEMHDMTKETVLLVLASKEYAESDYIRDYEEFKNCLF